MFYFAALFVLSFTIAKEIHKPYTDVYRKYGVVLHFLRSDVNMVPTFVILVFTTAIFILVYGLK